MSEDITESTSSVTPTSKRFEVSNLNSQFILVLFAAAVFIASLITAIFAYKFGHQRGFQASQNILKHSGDQISMTAAEIEGLNIKVQQLTEEVETAKHERDISLKNFGTMRHGIEKLEVTNLQLQQVNDVYAKALIAKNGMPLRVVGAKIAPLPENAFEYRFDIGMLARDGKAHLLKPTLTLLNETSLVDVPLQPSTYDIKGIARIRGRFLMPEKFTPKQVKLTLEANGEKIEQIYNWQLSSPIDKMPLSLSEVPNTDPRPVTNDE